MYGVNDDITYDPTIPSIGVEEYWHDGYNIMDDVFRSTILSGVCNWNWWFMEKNYLLDRKIIDYNCANCYGDIEVDITKHTLDDLICDTCKSSISSKAPKVLEHYSKLSYIISKKLEGSFPFDISEL